MFLSELRPPQKARITAVGRDAETASLSHRLRELGFLEGTSLQVVHEAPFGKDPIIVKVRGTFLALRREEALQVSVEISGQGARAPEGPVSEGGRG